MFRNLATASARQLTRAARPQPAAPRFVPALAARALHTSNVVRVQSDEADPQHPGKSDIDHLENPSLSEEAVHADREPVDPLKATKKAGSKIEDAAHQVQDAAKNAAKQAEGAAEQAQSSLKQAADAVKDAFNSAKGKKFHTSAVSRSGKPVEEQSAQHPGKSGHEHLDNPSMSEETVHADRSQKDPLPDSHKSSEKKKAKESAGVKDNVSELRTKETDDLPDGESTLRSIGGGN
ncbi:hypothetical protein JCM10213_006499 [Rhodosporidiobolus nylandii]